MVLLRAGVQKIRKLLFVLTAAHFCTHSGSFLYSQRLIFVLTAALTAAHFCTHSGSFLYSQRLIFVLTAAHFCTHSGSFLYSQQLIFVLKICSTQYADHGYDINRIRVPRIPLFCNIY